MSSLFMAAVLDELEKIAQRRAGYYPRLQRHGIRKRVNPELSTGALTEAQRRYGPGTGRFVNPDKPTSLKTIVKHRGQGPTRRKMILPGGETRPIRHTPTPR